MISDLLEDLINRRSAIIWFSSVQGLHTRLGVLQVCEVLVLQDLVLYIPSSALTVKKQIASLDREGCKIEGRAPH
jgi:hypothetical protein